MENRVNVQKQSEDREIRVTDLLWKILCSWRLILVCSACLRSSIGWSRLLEESAGWYCRGDAAIA